MITLDNLENFLSCIGFSLNGRKYIKNYGDFRVVVDLDAQTINYPEDKGFVVNERQTCNFSDNENFVVLECVNRLFEKGYKPQHIELEPRWTMGHTPSGGRADILIKNNSNKAICFIECKTFGENFDKEWKIMLLDGGQLFSYAVQDRNAYHLVLYASDFDGSNVEYINNIICIKDNDEYLKTLKHAASYKEAKTDVELYHVWKETYKLEYETNGMFEDDIDAYNIGKNKTSIENLRTLKNDDIQKTYFQFETILRQHNISGKENAFDKLVNLFLAKIVDEIQNPTNLQFYWRGSAFDDYFSLQDRLQKLYKEGMMKFLGEEVTYIDNAAIEEAFKLFGDDPDATMDSIMDYFRQLKFFTNNDFAFLDVHNENLFYQNAEVLLKMVKMLQNIKLKTEEQNQYLGDLFEVFLDSGIKQSEGQFFTPLPIVRFMVSSLPVKETIESNPDPIRAIDYACGAGHFLTEFANQEKMYVPSSSLEKYFSNIYGIEKEYRLSKVAKVSSFMYGQDGIKIVYADALNFNENIKNNSFDFLIANPPYSVSGFLEVIDKDSLEKYELSGTVSPENYQSNDDIELFFIERAKQLLKDGGVASIILPSTVLMNSNGQLNIKARDILLENFVIVAIVQYPSGTFFKTKNTDTIALFIKKRSTRVNLKKHYANRVKAWFEGDFSKDSLFKDAHFLEDYCSKIGVDYDEYTKFLKREPTDSFWSFDQIVMYKEAFENDQGVKKWLSSKPFSKMSKEEQETAKYNKLTSFIKEKEIEKVYNFIFATNENKDVIFIHSPKTSDEIKRYLGYSWKENEGIKYIGVDDKYKDVVVKNKGIEHISTPLFDPDNFEAANKINTLIRLHFSSDEVTIPEELSEYATVKSLNDMIDYDGIKFNKEINVLNIDLKFDTDYDLIPLNKCVKSIGGLWTGKNAPFKTVKVIRNTNFTKYGKLLNSKIETVLASESDLASRVLQPGDIIIEKSGGSKSQAVGRVVYFDLEDEFSFSNFTARLRPCNPDALPRYLHLFMNYIYLKGYTFSYQSGASGLKNLKLNKYLNIKIPLPKREVQEEAIDRANKLDEKFETHRLELDQYTEELEKILLDLKIINKPTAV